MRRLLMALTLVLAAQASYAQESKYYDVPKSDFPHDVAVGPSGEVWYSGQNVGVAGRLDASGHSTGNRLPCQLRRG